jgi:hypothetical protein
MVKRVPAGEIERDPWAEEPFQKSPLPAKRGRKSQTRSDVVAVLIWKRARRTLAQLRDDLEDAKKAGMVNIEGKRIRLHSRSSVQRAVAELAADGIVNHKHPEGYGLAS